MEEKCINVTILHPFLDPVPPPLSIKFVHLSAYRRFTTAQEQPKESRKREPLSLSLSSIWTFRDDKISEQFTSDMIYFPLDTISPVQIAWMEQSNVVASLKSQTRTEIY